MALAHSDLSLLSEKLRKYTKFFNANQGFRHVFFSYFSYCQRNPFSQMIPDLYMSGGDSHRAKSFTDIPSIPPAEFLDLKEIQAS